jgi:MFS family permease
MFNAPVLKIADFRSIFFTRLFSSMALQVQAVIVGWQIYQLRPDPLLLGFIGLAEAVPAITCSFVSGHIVDTFRPTKIFRLSLTAMFINACLMWFAILPQSSIAADSRLILLYLGIFISGAARSFSSPSVFAIIPQIVKREDLGAASAWNSSSFQFAAIIGPALGGLVFGFFGPVAAFALPPILQLTAVGLTWTLSARTHALKRETAREPFFKSVKAGILFAAGHRVLLSTMLLDMFSVLFGGAVIVLPMFADQVFKTGSLGLGFLRAAPSVGSVIVALMLGLKPMKVISGKTLLLVVAGFGLATIGFALSNNFYLALLFLAISGAFDGVSMVIRGTLLQLLTPEQMRGRVSSLSSVFITSSNEIGAFESGLAAKFMRLIPSVLFGGTMTVVIVLTTWWRAPELAQTAIQQYPSDKDAS